jgi:hypothetical protein
MKQRRGPGKQAGIYAPRLLPPPPRLETTSRTAALVAILVLLSACTARVPALASTLPDFSPGAGCERSGRISHGNVGVCALWASPQGVPTTHVISSRRQRRGARRERREPVNEQFLYRVPGPAEAAGVVRRLDVLPPDRLVGLAVIARGYGEDPEEFYVFANTEDLSEGERALIVDTFTAFGTPTALTIQHLARGTPRPHLFASGDVSTIIPTLLAYYPGVPGSSA